MLYRLAADIVLILHAGFIAFVVLGLVAVLVGGWLGWGWVRSPWFRVAHLLAILIVVLQAWLGVICPLTDLESWLRVRGGQEPYAPGGFIATWLQRLIFVDWPGWVFTLVYTLFGLLVAATFVLMPIRRTGKRSGGGAA